MRQSFHLIQNRCSCVIRLDGEVHGAAFEQASRYYRSTYASPYMSDMQLAKAIDSSYRERLSDSVTADRKNGAVLTSTRTTFAFYLSACDLRSPDLAC
ncbi:DUF2388 domain-containing protein [Pseudomonas sp. 2822-17]|uniref:DUF2388 domain-containing protein n=1 Tax=Pseudomonas sp. 2822-17 TaxID=1712678 RepID=UPI00117A11BA|nr:DUF2388 domain-containing protein [Pseudomonas sp. 2822-17]